MKKSDALAVISRRQFCEGLAGCLGIAAVASCGGSSSGTTDAPNMPDAPGSGSGATCGTGATDVGTASTFVLNKPVYFSSGNFFVVRDSGGLYALTARCTHQGVTVQAQTSQFYCNGHGGTFDFNGNPTGGPVFSPLVHYAMCTLANGHVGVNKSQTVAQSQRLNA